MTNLSTSPCGMLKQLSESKKFPYLWTPERIVSLLTVWAGEQLKTAPQPDETVKLAGFNDPAAIARVYRLQIIFLGKRFRVIIAELIMKSELSGARF